MKPHLRHRYRPTWTGWKNPNGRSQTDALQSMRERLLRETGDYLTVCLRHPELGVAIPAAPATKARFSKAVAEHFWGQVLFGR